MIISSRDELVKLINKCAVETYPFSQDNGTKTVHTIIYNKNKDKFYRVIWGEVADDDKVHHLWYDEEAREVYLNKSIWQGGWHTKEEIKEIDKVETKKREGLDMSEFEFENLEKNLVITNVLDGVDYDNINIVGGRAGSGKSWYALQKTVEAIKNGKSVLFFSLEMTNEEVVKRIISIMVKAYPEDLKKKENEEKVKAAMGLLKSSNLIVDSNPTIDNKYIINQMIARAKSVNGLDLVVIDHLTLDSGDSSLNNYDNVVNIHKTLDKLACDLDCKVQIITQLKR